MNDLRPYSSDLDKSDKRSWSILIVNVHGSLLVPTRAFALAITIPSVYRGQRTEVVSDFAISKLGNHVRLFTTCVHSQPD